jgi:hypothetical protein
LFIELARAWCGVTEETLKEETPKSENPRRH